METQNLVLKLAARYQATPAMRHGCAAVLFAHLLGERFGIDPISDLAQKAAMFFGECASIEAAWRFESACGTMEENAPRGYDNIVSNILNAMGIVGPDAHKEFTEGLLRQGDRLHRELALDFPASNSAESSESKQKTPPWEMTPIP